jgi:hypothetical protein
MRFPRLTVAVGKNLTIQVKNPGEITVLKPRRWVRKIMLGSSERESEVRYLAIVEQETREGPRCSWATESTIHLSRLWPRSACRLAAPATVTRAPYEC